MDLKRMFSALVIFVIVAAVLIFGNKYVVDVLISIVAIFSLYEYFHCFKEEEKNKNLSWVAYITAISIAFIHVIPQEHILKTIGLIIPISILILFAQVITTNMKYNIKDIAITLFGICYIVILLMYMSIIRETANRKNYNLVCVYQCMGNRCVCLSNRKKIWKTQIQRN